MMNGICARACPVAGAGTPAVAPYLLIATGMRHKMIYACTSKMMFRSTSWQSILNGIFAGECPVAGIGGLALAPRPLIPIRADRKMMRV